MKKQIAALAIGLALLVGGCAITAVVQPQPADTTEVLDLVGEYGAGGQGLSAMLGPGQGTLGEQILEKFGSKVRILGYWNWNDYSVNAVLAAAPANHMIGYFGDSCGASIGPFNAATQRRRVAVVIGTQASTYCPTSGFTDAVPANVTFAEETYNPSWIETFGLGTRVYAATSATRLTLVQRPDMHPDLQQDFFNDALDELSIVLAQSATLKKPIGGTTELVRYHGQRIR